MPIDYNKLLNFEIPNVEQRYGERDTMLYALGIGAGHDPVDETELRFVYEDGLKAMPSMAVVLGYPGFWIKDPATGVDWVRVVHGEQGMRLHQPVPVAATVVGRTRVKAIIDKGEGRGALIFQERVVTDAATGEAIATLTSTTFARGDGGFGGPAGPAPAPHSLPERAPDGHVDLPTLPQSALIYRLNGDLNPLHADPAVARKAGFERPILHGLCTFGVACRALVRAACEGAPERLLSQSARFSAPVYPGETIRTEYWLDGRAVSFRARALERDVVVLNNGLATIA